MIKVIIAGSRDFNDYRLLCGKCDNYLRNHWGEIEIISGMAPGADTLGVRYAEERCIPVVKFPANWGLHGRAAGPIRNKQMADYAGPGGYLVAFWDGRSAGTRDMIKQAKAIGMNVRVVSY